MSDLGGIGGTTLVNPAFDAFDLGLSRAPDRMSADGWLVPRGDPLPVPWFCLFRDGAMWIVDEVLGSLSLIPARP